VQAKTLAQIRFEEDSKPRSDSLNMKKQAGKPITTNLGVAGMFPIIDLKNTM